MARLRDRSSPLDTMIFKSVKAFTTCTPGAHKPQEEQRQSSGDVLPTVMSQTDHSLNMHKNAPHASLHFAGFLETVPAAHIGGTCTKVCQCGIYDTYNI